LGVATFAALPQPGGAKTTEERKLQLEQKLALIERESLGRLGVAVLDIESGLEVGLRAGERFPMCSTFKCLASAAVLKRVDGGELRLEQRIQFEAKDIVPY